MSTPASPSRARVRLFAALAAVALDFSTLPAASRAAAPIPSIEVRRPGKAFEGIPEASLLDSSAFAEWMDGAEKPFDSERRETTPGWVVWTDNGTPGHSGIAYGRSTTPGVRHMRIGFNLPTQVGTVIVNGGGALSLLKEDASYPGDLSNDAHWQRAQRLLKQGQLTSDPVPFGEYALWVFPPGTKTRALRFSHTANPADDKYQGHLGAVLITRERLVNLAGDAVISSRSNNLFAGKMINGLHEGWGAWENRDKRRPDDNEPVLSAANAEWITLTWLSDVRLRGLATFWSALGTVEVQTYAGAAGSHPGASKDGDWLTLGVFEGVQHGYPTQLWPNRLDFGREIVTRGVRIRVLSASTDEQHDHIKGTMLGRRRIWMGEVMALQSLGAQPLKTPAATSGSSGSDAGRPIPIKFTLREAGWVTLVIERPDGVRVRNLVSETPFPAGENTVWWDGTDDLGRDIDAARHGVYRIPARFVEPGEYRVRGLVRGRITPRYEFSVYATGSPPWDTPNHTGAWLANHSPPSAAVFVPPAQSPTGEPAVYLGSYVTEGPDGLAWVDLDGRKRGGKKWIGGNWTAAPYLARDAGANAAAGVYVYAGSVWETAKKSGVPELRITALTSAGDRPVLVLPLTEAVSGGVSGGVNFQPWPFMGGLAVHDGVVVVSLKAHNQLLFVYAAAGKILGRAAVSSPRGLVFDARGRLLVLSGTRLLRFDSITNPANLGQGVELVTAGLEDPISLTLDGKGGIYIGDLGESHQVKVFSADGKPTGVIGKPGAPKAGPYDPLRLQNPAGLAIDSKNQLWVAENDFLPKRVSVWTLDGRLVNAFYGPGKYGGGGALDPADKTKFYYGEEHHGAMEFKLDWTKGTFELVNVYYRPKDEDMALGFRSAAPESVLYRQGRRYFTNAYNSNPIAGHGTAFLFLERGGIARPVAAMGRASDWDTLKGGAFRLLWPEGVNLASKNAAEKRAFFIWSDFNADGGVQPEEVVITADDASGVTVMDDLSFCIARMDGTTTRFSTSMVDAKGIPRYDIARGEPLAKQVHAPASSGGNQALAVDDGWTVVTLGMEPFSPYSLSGAMNGVAKWSYPNLWPGLHASHEAPMPDQPGQLIGPTRLLGGLMKSRIGSLWAINSNHGCVYLFTADGLFVATVFEDMRQGKRWQMPAAQRGMSLAGLTLNDENFWPTITQVSDGTVYLVDGGRSSIVRLEGLDGLSRLPDASLTVSREDVERSQTYLMNLEASRQQKQGKGVLVVGGPRMAPKIDGKLGDWANASWVDIDKRGLRAYFNSSSTPYDVTGAVAVASGRLYAAWRTNDAGLLENSGEMPVAPFKTGGALDLMIGANPNADPGRVAPVAGDARLLVTLVNGNPRALLYRAVVPGTPDGTGVPFSSPWRTLTFDRVDDVTSQIEFARNQGDYEISIPMEMLGLRPAAGATITGDIGILRGQGGQTTARIYWSNKATGTTADVPSEAMLTPHLWGRWEFKSE